MNALVTGSAGFIGRHMVAELRQRGHAVSECDILEGSDCRDVYAGSTRFDLLVHCAAVIPDRLTRTTRPHLVAENLDLDQAAFAFCERTGTPLLFLSSCAVYDPSTFAVKTEGDETGDADGLYGQIKLMGETLCRSLDATIVRPFSGYGTDQSDSYPFRAILDRALRHEDPLDIWTNSIRDFVHVSDFVNAALRLRELGVPGPVNIGTGVGTTMCHLARLAANAAGYEPEIRVLNSVDGGGDKIADPTLLNRFYTCEVTIEKGVSSCLTSS